MKAQQMVLDGDVCKMFFKDPSYLRFFKRFSVDLIPVLFIISKKYYI